MTDWARVYFERGYAQRWNLTAASEVTRLEAAHLWDALLLRPSVRVVDVGCGHGKYSSALTSLGAAVVGVDLAAALLGRAKQLSARFLGVQGDMRFLPLRSAQFGAAVLLDAFGFFEGEEENDAVLSEIQRVLGPGGRVALKVANASPILSAFRATDREEHDGVTVELARVVTAEPARLIERMTIRTPTETGEYERRQRLYRPEELFAALERAGLSVVTLQASLSGAPFLPASSPAMHIVAERRRDV